MIKTILVFTDGSPHGDVATRYGVYFARELGASLLGLHVLDSRMLEGPLMADISGWIGAQPYGAQLKQFRELLEQRGESVMAAFNKICAEAGVACESWVKLGHPARVLLEEEAKAELVIIGQKGEHADFGGDLVGSTTERISRHSVKPCLVVPGTFEPVKRILVAYDGSGHASQALHEAIELALALQVELDVLIVREAGDTEAQEQLATDAARLAEAHGCTPSTVLRDGRPEDAVIEQAKQSGANLIVVGAHGHARIREMFIGSTTAQLIARSDVPVMIVR